MQKLRENSVKIQVRNKNKNVKEGRGGKHEWNTDQNNEWGSVILIQLAQFQWPIRVLSLAFSGKWIRLVGFL